MEIKRDELTPDQKNEYDFLFWVKIATLAITASPLFYFCFINSQGWASFLLGFIFSVLISGMDAGFKEVYEEWKQEVENANNSFIRFKPLAELADELAPESDLENDLWGEDFPESD